MSDYGTTWEDIEPTRPHDKEENTFYGTTNALDRFVREPHSEVPWTPWTRQSHHPGDRYAELIIHRTPTKPMEMYTSDQQVAIQLMKSNNDWPSELSCGKCNAKYHTSFSLMTHMGGHTDA